MVEKISCVYLLEYSDGIKIGMSSDFIARLKNYLKPWAKDVLSVHYVERPYPRYLEALMLDHFKDSIEYRSSTEYVVGLSINILLWQLERIKLKAPNGELVEYGEGINIVSINLSKKTS